MSQSKIAQVAQILDNAAHTAQEVDQFAPGHFTLPEAYEIQRASIDHRVQRGEKMVGIKLGFTSRAKMIQMGVDSLIWGLLTDGMLEEARRVYPFRKLNSLNTVGYKELFKYLDGEWTLDFAIEKIKRNSRVYARKQMTWFKRDTDIRWFHPDEKEAILCYLDATLNTRL